MEVNYEIINIFNYEEQNRVPHILITSIKY